MRRRRRWRVTPCARVLFRPMAAATAGAASGCGPARRPHRGEVAAHDGHALGQQSPTGATCWRCTTLEALLKSLQMPRREYVIVEMCPKPDTRPTGPQPVPCEAPPQHGAEAAKLWAELGPGWQHPQQGGRFQVKVAAVGVEVRSRYEALAEEGADAEDVGHAEEDWKMLSRDAVVKEVQGAEARLRGEFCEALLQVRAEARQQLGEIGELMTEVGAAASKLVVRREQLATALRGYEQPSVDCEADGGARGGSAANTGGHGSNGLRGRSGEFSAKLKAMQGEIIARLRQYVVREHGAGNEVTEEDVANFCLEIIDGCDGGFMSEEQLHTGLFSPATASSTCWARARPSWRLGCRTTRRDLS